MKVKFIGLLILFLILISCKGITTPDIPPLKKANLILDGELSRTMTSYGCPQFEGYVKNTGNNTGYNCMISITCYSDTAKTTIIDTAKGFPANLGDIPAGIRAYFNAVAFDCISHNQIKETSIKITWLDRQ